MSDGYRLVLDRAVEVLGADDRIVALFAVGSVGRGDADIASDLDLLAAVADQGALDGLLANWGPLIDEITPSVYRRLLGGHIVTLVTPSWERVDIAFLPANITSFVTSGPATVLFDRGDTDPPSAPVAALRSAAELVGQAENFMRSVGLMVTDLERGEYTVLSWASEFLIQELVDVMFVEAGVPRRTVKRIYADLPAADRQVLERLPRATTTRDSIIESHLAITSAFLPRAKSLIASAGGTWPESLEAATDLYLRSSIGVGFNDH